MKKILLLVCIPLLLPLAAQADVSVDINVPGVSLHLGDQDRRGYYWDGYDWRPPQWWHAHQGRGLGSAMRAVCTGTADAGNLRRRVAMNIASRHAAAIRSTAIAIIATTTAVMTIVVTMTAVMTPAVSLIHRATPARIVNP